MKRRIALLSAGLLVALAGHAQAPQATAPASPPAPIVLKAAHLFDGRTGQLSEPGLVVVQDGRITGVGAAANVPAGSRVIDLGDATLLPGFIDAHVHIADNHDDNWAQGIYENMLRFPAEQSFHAARNAMVTLQAGVTTARNVGAPDFVDVALRNAINAGLAEGPRLLVAGHALGSTGGHCDSSPYPTNRVTPAGPLEGVCNGASEPCASRGRAAPGAGVTGAWHRRTDVGDAKEDRRAHGAEPPHLGARAFRVRSELFPRRADS